MPLGLMTPAVEVTDERQKTFITNVQNKIGGGAEWPARSYQRRAIPDPENDAR